MKNYVGVKMVKAVPQSKETFEAHKRGVAQPNNDAATPGYKVVYPDGYESWSPKDVFEQAYMAIGDDNKILEQNIDDFIVNYDTKQWGDKTTIVMATLTNGFVMTEPSSCEDPANFNIDIGERICRERIHNRLWELLGFVLQCGVGGMKGRTVFGPDRYYEHVNGGKIHTLSECATTKWGRSLIMETEDGRILALTMDAAAGWYEITKEEWGKTAKRFNDPVTCASGR